MERRLNISIHAPREGSDRSRRYRRTPAPYFYPRSPRGERLRISIIPARINGFLSTLPARGATLRLAPWEFLLLISIHAPREGSDDLLPWLFDPAYTFLSTLPARGATLVFISTERRQHISIHAPREGSDSGGRHYHPQRTISIHAPREGSDPGCQVSPLILADFYPRSPRGERLYYEITYNGDKKISIHAPREGSDPLTNM